MSPTTRVAPLCSASRHDHHTAGPAPLRAVRSADARRRGRRPCRVPAQGADHRLGPRARARGRGLRNRFDRADRLPGRDRPRGQSGRRRRVRSSDRAWRERHGRGNRRQQDRWDPLRRGRRSRHCPARPPTQRRERAIDGCQDRRARRSRARAWKPSSPPSSRAGGTPDASRKSGISSVPDGFGGTGAA